MMKKLKTFLVTTCICAVIAAAGFFGVYQIAQTAELPEEAEGLVSETEPFYTGNGMKLAMERIGELGPERTKIVIESLKYPEYQFVWTKNGASYINEIPGDYEAYNLTRADFQKNLDTIMLPNNSNESFDYTLDIDLLYRFSKTKLRTAFNRDYKKYPENLKDLEDLSVCHYAFDFFDPKDGYFMLEEGVEELPVHGLPASLDFLYVDGGYKTKCGEPEFVKLIHGETLENRPNPRFAVTFIYKLDLTTIAHENKENSIAWFPAVGETNELTLAISGAALVKGGISSDFQPYSIIILDYKKAEE